MNWSDWAGTAVGAAGVAAGAIVAAAAATGHTLRRVVQRARVAVLSGEVGQSMVEYSLLAALIGIAALAVITGFGTTISTVFSNMTAKLAGLGR